jgi:manganese/zinc-transporting P-type ATPase C
VGNGARRGILIKGGAHLGLLVSAGGAMSPVVAAILHNASSVAVVANSSRLIRYRLAG